MAQGRRPKRKAPAESKAQENRQLLSNLISMLYELGIQQQKAHTTLQIESDKIAQQEKEIDKFKLLSLIHPHLQPTLIILQLELESWKRTYAQSKQLHKENNNLWEYLTTALLQTAAPAALTTCSTPLPEHTSHNHSSFWSEAKSDKITPVWENLLAACRSENCINVLCFLKDAAQISQESGQPLPIPPDYLLACLAAVPSTTSIGGKIRAAISRYQERMDKPLVYSSILTTTL